MRCEYAPMCQGTIAQGTCDYCGVPPTDNSDTSLPTDYEACGDCGFDHEYEPNEANKAHQDMIKGKVR